MINIKGIIQLLFLCISLPVLAQNIEVNTNAANSLVTAFKDTAASVEISKIIIIGNKKTKPFIILREMHFKQGDSLKVATLNTQLQLVKQQIYNTNLFSDVSINVLQNIGRTIDIYIVLKERWYIFPLPQFKLVDRNLNEWINKSNANLNRVIYGVKFTHFNLSGRKDQLKIVVLNGFNRNISFWYNKPFVNKKLTNGITFGAGYGKLKEFIYKTTNDNKPLFFNNTDFSREDFFANIGYEIRKNIFTTHSFTVNYLHTFVTDSLLSPQYNPNLFNSNLNAQNIVDISYTLKYINTNNIAYPLKGTTGFAKINKRGLDFSGQTNALSLEIAANKYWDLKNKWYASAQSYIKCVLPFEQAYINRRALGYDEYYLRGLELFVIDGTALGMLRNTIKRKILTLNIPLPFRSSYFNNFPITIFAKSFVDVGYVYAKEKYANNLNNTFLYTGGVGIDILTFYDLNIRIEYSFNQLNKNGLFLHTKSGM
jgi:outer membrane protein assembly factor BamA